ncbi:MAG: NAD(P)/FAD-dependent oxidoreductase [Acidobacteriaceae bacterium]|nr:NAD(P)/FAD-dependent oxidoreductase [Acidobacteriaceae bacterium]MBV9780915.1 NAD(P)/FAD-dependent oxidoreductase [Acidobacteriaceae bacterium]
MKRRQFASVVVVGAGPAGLAAAIRASESGRQVTVLDDNPSAGGQIWRGEKDRRSGNDASAWFQKFRTCPAEMITGARLIHGDPERRILSVETRQEFFEIGYDKLILATGAREFFLPFPGWTLPNVMGVGGLQALVKSGLPVDGKRIVVAGTGPLLLAAAAYFRKHGAIVPVIAEQAEWRSVAGFGIRLSKNLGKLFQARSLRLALRSSRYTFSTWVEAAHGKDRLENAQVRTGAKVWREPCDYLAVGYGLKPNIELPVLMGCRTQSGVVAVDEFQQTSQEHIYCAGECTGIGGVDKSLIEGEITGLAAAGLKDSARRLFAKRRKTRQFANVLDRAFALRPELRQLPLDGTIVCRCEDVRWGRLRPMNSWRSAKLESRCGMGPCQGRVCGQILEFLLGWHPESVRPPVFPARLESLTQDSEMKESLRT